jgi:hypothetical protein
MLRKDPATTIQGLGPDLGEEAAESLIEAARLFSSPPVHVFCHAVCN